MYSRSKSGFGIARILCSHSISDREAEAENPISAFAGSAPPVRPIAGFAAWLAVTSKDTNTPLKVLNRREFIISSYAGRMSIDCAVLARQCRRGFVAGRNALVRG